MKKEQTKEQLFDIYVSNVAAHCAELRVVTGRFSATAVEGMPVVEIFVEPRTEGEIDVWDMCYHIHKDGTKETLGNRCAAVSRYSSVAAQALRSFLNTPQ